MFFKAGLELIHLLLRMTSFHPFLMVEILLCNDWIQPAEFHLLNTKVILFVFYISPSQIDTQVESNATKKKKNLLLVCLPWESGMDPLQKGAYWL